MNLESSPYRRSWNQATMLSLLTSMEWPGTFTFTSVTSKLAKSSGRVSQSKFVRSEAFLLVLHCPSITSWIQAIMPGAAIFASPSSRHVKVESTLLQHVVGQLQSNFPRGLSKLRPSLCYTVKTTPQVSPYRSLTTRFWGRRRYSSTRRKLVRRFRYVLPR